MHACAYVVHMTLYKLLRMIFSVLPALSSPTLPAVTSPALVLAMVVMIMIVVLMIIAVLVGVIGAVYQLKK